MSARFRTFLALALGVVTVAAAEKARTYQTGAQWLVVVALGTAFVVALCAAGTAVAAVVWFGLRYTLYERRLAEAIAACAPPPSARHARPVPPAEALPEPDPRTVTRDARVVDYYGDDSLAEARAAAAMAEQPGTIGYTAVLPTPVITGVTWGFDGTSRVVGPLDGPWSPSVAEPVAAGAQRGRTW